MSKLCHTAVELVRHQVADRSSPIEKEARSRFRLIYYIAEKSRKPLAQFISAAVRKLLLHFHGPCLRAAFPAVEKQSVKQSFPTERTFGQAAYITREMCFRTFCREFVAFPTGALNRRRAILLAGIHMTDAENRPIAVRWCGPCQTAVSRHMFSYITYALGLYICIPGLYEVISRALKASESKACL